MCTHTSKEIKELPKQTQWGIAPQEKKKKQSKEYMFSIQSRMGKDEQRRDPI